MKTKKIVAALLLVVICLTGLLVGCSSKPIEEDDIDPIAVYYFNQKCGETGWSDWDFNDDTVVNAKEAWCVSAFTEDGDDVYTIAILKDGSGVYSYGLETGKAQRIGGCNVG